MKLERRIYCVEGVWGLGHREVEPSVEPLLEMLRRQGLWDYARRDCATTAELKHYLSEEWSGRTDQLLCFARDDKNGTDVVVGSAHPRLRDWPGVVDLGLMLGSGVLG